MNLDDARTVLEWLGYEWMTLLPHPDGVTFDEVDPMSGNSGFAFRLDANWVHGTLIPALATLFPPKWGIDVFHGWDGAPVLVYFFGVGVETLRGTGPTFEAAMISAAARAVRSV